MNRELAFARIKFGERVLSKPEDESTFRIKDELKLKRLRLAAIA